MPICVVLDLLFIAALGFIVVGGLTVESTSERSATFEEGSHDGDTMVSARRRRRLCEVCACVFAGFGFSLARGVQVQRSSAAERRGLGRG
jgi:hypothetical protein